MKLLAAAVGDEVHLPLVKHPPASPRGNPAVVGHPSYLSLPAAVLPPMRPLRNGRATATVAAAGSCLYRAT